jgi:hypothetical protein
VLRSALFCIPKFTGKNRESHSADDEPGSNEDACSSRIIIDVKTQLRREKGQRATMTGGMLFPFALHHHTCPRYFRLRDIRNWGEGCARRCHFRRHAMSWRMLLARSGFGGACKAVTTHLAPSTWPVTCRPRGGRRRPGHVSATWTGDVAATRDGLKMEMAGRLSLSLSLSLSLYVRLPIK